MAQGRGWSRTRTPAMAQSWCQNPGDGTEPGHDTGAFTPPMAHSWGKGGPDRSEPRPDSVPNPSKRDAAAGRENSVVSLLSLYQQRGMVAAAGPEAARTARRTQRRSDDAVPIRLGLTRRVQPADRRSRGGVPERLVFSVPRGASTQIDRGLERTPRRADLWAAQ